MTSHECMSQENFLFLFKKTSFVEILVFNPVISALIKTLIRRLKSSNPSKAPKTRTCFRNVNLFRNLFDIKKWDRFTIKSGVTVFWYKLDIFATKSFYRRNAFLSTKDKRKYFCWYFVHFYTFWYFELKS